MPIKLFALAALLLTLLAVPAFSFTLSGSISGGELFGGISYVYAFHTDTLNLTPYIGLTPLGNGPYLVFNVPAGSYLLFAFQDRDGNLLPSVGDLMGFYGDSLPAVVEVTGNTSGLNIALAELPVTGISGTISCPPGPTGLTLIQAATDPAFTNVAANGFLLDLSGNGTYSLFVDPGQYYVRAFLDADFSFGPSTGDPQSYWGYPNNPLLINVTTEPVSNINMTLNLQHQVSVTLTPQGAPIVIPPGEGTFTYSGTVANNDSLALTEKLWLNTTLPDGSTQPILGPVTLNLPAGISVTRVRTQSVPPNAPPGEYSFNAFLGIYPVIVWAQDSFPFTKSGSGIRDLGFGDWTSSGQDFGAAEQPLITHNSEPITSLRPNPFNPSTAISYKLQATSYISLKVYDTAGRLVATLVESTRPAGIHTVHFDGSNLPSGIYLARFEAGEFNSVLKMVLMK